MDRVLASAFLRGQTHFRPPCNAPQKSGGVYSAKQRAPALIPQQSAGTSLDHMS